MLYVLLAHLVMALGAPALVSFLGRRAFLVMALAPASAAAYALAWTDRVMSGEHPTQVIEWVPGLGLELAFRMDTLSWLMLLLVGGVGALVLVYCSAYFSPTAQGLRRFGGVLTAFAGAMVGLVTADDMLLLFVFWELTTVFSYLLIGHYADRKASRRAAMQAIILTTAGGLAMLVGVVILGVQGGTFRMSEIIADPPTGGAVTAAIVCLLVGAASKSALIPLHFWLPAAMAAPTPVSAYLHAAAMVKAGVYLVARFAPAYSDTTVWRTLVVVLGAGTLLVGGYRALRQYDLKLVLAFGTVSQLGLIILLVGLGTRGAALAGLAMIGAHAMFKASLFLVVGVVDAAAGTRDLRRLTGVGKALPWTAVAGGLATASMIGLPPFAGYVAKEAALESLLHGEGPVWVDTVVLWSVVVGSMFTVAYGLRFWWGAFASKPHLGRSPARANAHEKAWGAGAGTGTARRPVVEAEEPPIDPARIHRQPFLLVGPAVVLAVLGLATALVPHFGEDLLAPYADTYPVGEPGHLVLWAGFTPALALTVLVLAVGVVLFWQRSRVERFQASLWTGPEADVTYRKVMRKLDDLAADITAVTQRGSLPFYLGAILVVLVLGPGVVMVAQTAWPEQLRAWDRPAQLVAVAAICIASVLAARSRRRLKAVILVGIAGYGNAVLFLLHGAPDLALTQVLVETITLVVMVLVLRRLPAYFSNRPLAASRWVRLGIGLAVAVVMMGFALVAPLARVATPISVDFPAEAYEFGHGKNIVNVTLVDIRAWDTMGEISVLLAAATGVASLVFLRSRSGEILRASGARPATTATGSGVWSDTDDPGAALRRRGVTEKDQPRMLVWLSAGRTLAPQRRSVIFEVVTRVLFHAMIVFALFLLFSGHNAPGGGFAAGLVVGIALIVRYLAGGRYELGEAAPVHPGLLLGTGLFLSAGVGLVAFLLTGNVLGSEAYDLALPLVGEIHLVTSLFFDVGVFLVVVGLVLDILRTLGAEIDRHAERAAAGREPGEDTGPFEAMEPDSIGGGRR
ncbi:multisubunit sodium/proton antiporter, MrpA subunit /multisubunit sodium/proton antiporter, MrpB subunit [Cellulosimicrobium aquatile]|uniref:Multisubunit sodium/proton antiporter, MrpA subunit /multisubunit sodium/proton antiporter, MrpB subunit n=1 Tax=Cellulosimicrobium aquatile TaxID=1612203 RepID=A0A1N6NKW9_9MICO|nr:MULTISPECIES: Na+/H+ antiporter subunit A [Cellulosimicrobium]MDQ8041369.1 Na+/H+ antiporter subunit A [Cellulosimicrobium sp. XJ-DQ-B-000]NMF30625.1 Na+/H+ antiporter subunit A [Cellulosimicrobium aquatile]SIP92616.1 multisubunit sodium/proton antiporter, MrpA subunit /multisubunit sodium/proton antiporter, MrpB subunit [Cellulosimicrobium aquatile]